MAMLNALYSVTTEQPAALNAGTEPIRIQEKQSFEWVDDNTLKITSVPVLQVSVVHMHTQLLSDFPCLVTAPVMCFVGSLQQLK